MPRGRKKAEVTEMIEQIIPEAEETKEEKKVEKKAKAVEKKYDGRYIVDVSTFLNIREGAGKQYAIKGKYDNGAVIECDGTHETDKNGDEWVLANDGSSSGYCMLKYLKKM